MEPNIRTIDEFGKVVIPRQLRIMHDLQTFRGTVKCLTGSNELYLYSDHESFDDVNTERLTFKELKLDDFGRISVLSIFGSLKRVQFIENFNPNNYLKYIEVKPI